MLVRTTLAAILGLTPLLAGVSGEASLVDVVKAGNRQAAIEMIDQHANVNAAASDGSTALQWAAHNGDTDLVARLLRAGADAKAKNQFGASAMSEAAFLGNVDILGQLLKAGADPDSLRVGLDERFLVIAGRRQESARLRCGSFVQKEIAHGDFVKRIPLPVPIEYEGVAATYEDGLLVIVAPIAVTAYMPTARTELHVIVKRTNS